MAKAERPKYGGRGRPWHPDFIGYVEEIARHPAYAGMPDAFPSPGRIQWEAPSNRGGGRFKDTHHKRRRWWELKAKESGIDPTSASWISRTAKTIHPFKRKPCKICGRVLELRYTYPRARLLQRISQLPFVDPAFQLDGLEPVTELLRRLHSEYGNVLLTSLPALLSTPSMGTPAPPPRTIDDWIAWIDKVYIPAEPPLLSPGAMSNAPDRFDGFHSDNLCCRGTADKGRTKTNLSRYVTDRRVFEYWTAGDWIAADRMMGLFRSESFEEQSCRNGHPGPCSADHVGPISLGFVHSPYFQALCRSCNSGKNNRMTASDVALLKLREGTGEPVVSWHCKALWNKRSGDVENNETALRLSKLLRDNRHALMFALQKIADAGHFRFLTTLLELHYADYSVTFTNLQIIDHITKFDKITRTRRTTKYAAEQKARRCRIAFQELLTYFEKDNRNSFVVASDNCHQLLGHCITELRKVGPTALDGKIKAAAMGAEAEEQFLGLVDEISSTDPNEFQKARAALNAYMDCIGETLGELWNNERYVRT